MTDRQTQIAVSRAAMLFSQLESTVYLQTLTSHILICVAKHKRRRFFKLRDRSPYTEPRFDTQPAWTFHIITNVSRAGHNQLATNMLMLNEATDGFK